MASLAYVLIILFLLSVATCPGSAQEDGTTTIELYNSTVNLTQGNFTFTPENDTETYTIDNLTDFGALNATGLEFNVSVMRDLPENMTGNMTGNENGDMNGNITDDENGNMIGDMNGNITDDENGNMAGMNGNMSNATADNTANVSFALEGIENITNKQYYRRDVAYLHLRRAG